MSELLTTAEAGRIVRKHPKTIERAIRRGTLRACRLSGGDHGPYGVRREWLDEWIEGCVVQPRSQPPQPLPTPAPASSKRGRLTVLPGMGRDSRSAA